MISTLIPPMRQANVFASKPVPSIRTSDPFGYGKVYQSTDSHVSMATPVKSLPDATPVRKQVARIRADVTPAKTTMRARCTATPTPTRADVSTVKSSSMQEAKSLPQATLNGNASSQVPSKVLRSGYGGPCSETRNPMLLGSLSAPIKAAVAGGQSHQPFHKAVLPRSPAAAQSAGKRQRVPSDELQAPEQGLQRSLGQKALNQSSEEVAAEEPAKSCSPVKQSTAGDRPLAKRWHKVSLPPALPKEVDESEKLATFEAKVEPVKVEVKTAEVAKVDLASMTMVVEELKVSTDAFDPCEPGMKLQLVERLGFSETAVVEKLGGDQGAFNLGVWAMYHTNSLGVILKLVPHQARAFRASDAEKYIKLQAQRPLIPTELSLAFPLKVLQLKGPTGTISHDLIVMRRAPGFQLTYHLCHKFHGGAVPALLDIFEEFGTFLCTIHRVYKGMQHGDCQPSNVFYDESSGFFTLIDVADMGFGPYFADGGEDDVEHFITGLKSLTQWYSETVIDDCEKQFRKGYLEEKRKNGNCNS